MLGLEEDKITWYSNNSVPFICYTLDLEGCEIAGFSNLLLRCKDKEIAGHSNIYWLIVTAAKGLAEDKITWFSNTDVAGVAQSSALEKSKLHGTQTLRCARAIGRKV